MLRKKGPKSRIHGEHVAGTAGHTGGTSSSTTVVVAVATAFTFVHTTTVTV